MKKSIIITAICMTQIVSSCSRKEIQVPPVIPRPDQMETTGGVNILGDNQVIYYRTDSLKESAALLADIMNESGFNYSVEKGNGKDKKGIFIEISGDIQDRAGSYELRVNKRNITISSPDIEGIKYAIATMKQLAFFSGSPGNSIPCMLIKDHPRFPYRGMHLDVSRHFMPVDFIKKYIDYLFLFKFNYFHWHLVDDQGWRVEIKKYPLLTEKGSKRKETLIGNFSERPHKYDGTPYEGFYSQEEIRDIVDYAKLRNITIIPEIELPGHSQAAIASYPFLGCTGEGVEVKEEWGISKYLYNIEDTTFNFLYAVFDEICELFPGKYIHIGGDEAIKDQWKASASIQKKMKELGLSDEEELQKYFIERISGYLAGKGRQIIGWDEITEGGIPNNAIVMYWRWWNRELDIPMIAAEQDHYVIMTPTFPLYFDYYQSLDKNEPLAIGGYSSLCDVYQFEPVPESFDSTLIHYIMGAQANVWTEYMESPQQVEYMIFPRMIALSEVLWTERQNRDLGEFLMRLKNFEPFLIKNNINYCRHIFK
jgi:hexosaminidase